MHDSRASIVIVTPALAEANNGNWRTAERWARLLSAAYRVRLVKSWEPERGAGDDLMIALHARRSAASVEAWRAQAPRRPLVVALTGTDLYQDLAVDPSARRSVDVADALVVLNERGPARLAPAERARCHVVLQSCGALEPCPAARPPFVALMVGHLRDVKDPRAFFRAVRRLGRRSDLAFHHIGEALDDTLGAEARALAAADPRYRWLGPLPHAETREHIRVAHLLVHPSTMEGGAQAVIEAVTSGVPVLASRVDGNVGLLGDDYQGYFEPGDDAALAALLARVADDPTMLAALRRQAAARAPLFSPAREAAALEGIASALLAACP